jgi:LEA14-like dessication related protein
MRYFLVMVGAILFLTGCKFDEPVVFRTIDNVKVKKIIDGMVHLSADAEFYNPNEISGKLKSVNIVVALENTKLATVSQSKTLTIDKEAGFIVPIDVQFAMEDVQKGFLSNLLNLVNGNKIKLHFKGEIKVSTWGFTQTVPVDYYEEVKL